MKLTLNQQKYLQSLKIEFDRLKVGKDSLLAMLDEAEIPEMVYNSNAIENSTLTLPETEKILLDQEASRDLNLREVYEAKNLSRLNTYLHTNAVSQDLSESLILLLHQMLIGVIDDSIAGRLRKAGEYVHVGIHIAPAPEHVSRLLSNALLAYKSDHQNHFLTSIAQFHLEFETIHPFNDGNGRIGRILINWQLARLGFPPLILRNKGKDKYYDTFGAYRNNGDINPLVHILYLALTESLHKRLAYLRSEKIIDLADYAKSVNTITPIILNKARRQTINAFREKGVWRIGVKQ